MPFTAAVVIADIHADYAYLNTAYYDGQQIYPDIGWDEKTKEHTFIDCSIIYIHQNEDPELSQN